MIVDSQGELPVAVPHVSDEEDNGKPFGGSALREQKAISFSINVPSTHKLYCILDDRSIFPHYYLNCFFSSVYSIIYCF